MNLSAPRSLLALTLLSVAACKTVDSQQPAAQAPSLIAVEPVAPVSLYADAKLGIDVAQGELTLPSRYFRPRLRPAPGETGVAHVYLVRPPETAHEASARKEQHAERREAIERAGPELAWDQALRAALRCYGRRHGGVGPASLDEPDWLRCAARGPYAEDEEAQLPPPPPYADDSEEGEAIAALKTRLARFALLPRVPLRRELLGEDWAPGAPAPARKAKGKGKAKAAAEPAKPPPEVAHQPLFVEVAPAADDGLHWVVDNALRASEGRVTVDAALLARHGLSIRKDLLVSGPAPLAGPDDRVKWTVYALRRGGAAEVALELEPDRGAPVQRVTWAVGKGAAGEPESLKRWAQIRLQAQDVFGAGDGPLQRPLVVAARGAYGLDGGGLDRLADRRSDGDDTGPSFLALLGGRAAVDETLQLDRELGAMQRTPGAPSVAIAEIPGIQAEPHPWGELLAGRKAPRLPLADCVPPDRAMLYLPQPKEAVDGFEHGAASFLQRVSSFAREGRLDYAVIERYLGELGLGDGLGRKLLKLGAIKEAVIFTPDLSLLAGTDVTVVAEISALFEPLLPIAEGEVREKVTPGGKSFKARRGARVFISNSRAELERALALDAAGGAGSMGKSDELAFLLLQLAPTARTQAFAYLSDPFIRRLVGPGQRIGQLRLDAARAEMELLAGAALLRRQDVPAETPTIDGLKRMGYLPPAFPESAYALLADGRVSSPIFGALERLLPVSRMELAKATEEEAELYGRFREGYERYWRRFFDPIAVRFDSQEDGRQELETFILPLLDSSIYREAGRALSKKARPSMTSPRWNFPATIEASVQLPDEAMEAAKGLRHAPDSIERAAGTALEEIVGALAPTAHIAVADASPIVHVGGGSAFGPATSQLSRSGEAGLAIVAAAVTRPLVLALELKDPETVRRALDRVPSPDAFFQARRWRDGPDFRLMRDEANRLLFTADFLGIAALRFSVNVEDRWLLLSNDVNLPAKLVAGSQELRGAAASVALRPGALKLGLPSAWQSAVEAEADAAWAGQHWLAPWLANGLSVADAQQASRTLLGTAPVMAPDALLAGANNMFENHRYGSRFRPRLPPLRPGDFGLFEGISEARVEMNFEGDGLRTRVTWSGAGK